MKTGTRIANYLGALALLIIAFSFDVSAQTITGTISGIVTDTTSAAIEGSLVKVTNIDTQATRTATTEPNGFYTITNLPIGRYTVEVAKAGFNGRVRKGLELVADGRLTADFTLEVGSLQQLIGKPAFLAAHDKDGGKPVGERLVIH